jgi:perosamine synthetase
MERIGMVDVKLGEEELRNVTDAIKTGWISSKGSYIKQFEQDFSKYVGMKYGITTTSGTTALHLALVALGVGKKDEVLVPSFTHVSNANCVYFTGAKPVFLDSHKDYWGVDPEKIEAKITPKTKAIILVHIYGHPCDMDPIMEIAKKHNLKVIEDCAESPGAKYKGKMVGTFGDISCYSFYGNKIITTGEGGMCLTNDPELDRLMRMYVNMGINPQNSTKRKYWFDVIGFNYRMTNMQAAIGVAQCKRIEQMVDQRRRVAHEYNRLFAGHKGIVPQPEMPWAKNVYWYYTILVDKKLRDTLIDKLEAKGIETRTTFYPINMLPIFKTKYKSKVSAMLGERGINLPSGPSLTDEQMKYIAQSVIDILKEG